MNNYPFGSLLPNRNFNSNSYRFGFNGQEKDDEITGVTGSHLNFKYRMYDTRIARFFAVDPLAPKYPELTPYQFASLNPIWMREIEGLEGTEANKAEAKEALDKSIERSAKDKAEEVAAFENKNENRDDYKTTTKVDHLKNDIPPPKYLKSFSDQHAITDNITETLESGKEISYSMHVSVPLAKEKKTIEHVAFMNLKKFPEGKGNPFFSPKPVFYVEFWSDVPNEGKDAKRIAVYMFSKKEDYVAFKKEKFDKIYQPKKERLKRLRK